MRSRRREWLGPAGAIVMLTLVLALLEARSLVAQAPAESGAQPAAAAAPQTPGQTPAEPAQSEPYSYKPEGRRDPFVSLVARGIEPTPQAKGSSMGVGGLTTGEISVRGVVQSRGAYVAMVQAPDGKTYIVHPNDRLIDGVVTQITPQGLVIMQEVNDPLSLVKQREIRKSLRSAEEGK